jgi:2-polyprenyl-3-methyl-5-hydroxy-6-metoxy-1,4-benzoquinol methylase
MSGVVPAEIQHRRMGDAIAIDGAYQHRALTEGFVVQRFWHAEKLRMIEKFSRPENGENVLDIGCGSGVISDALRRHGAMVTAVDGNPDAIAYARRTFGRDGIDFRLGQVEDIDAEPGSIDRSYCFEVVEHLYINQVDALFSRALDLAKPGGTLTVTTPNYRGVWPAIEWTLDTLRLVPHLDGDQHVTRFNASRLRETLERAGWNVELMTTFSTIAPWLSIAGWNLATRVAETEDAMKLPWGSVLFAVARTSAD